MHLIGKLFLLLVLIGLGLAAWLLIGPNLADWSWTKEALNGTKMSYESLFAPVAALFSGCAAGVTIYAIINQGKQFSLQQFENNFFSLIAIHRENRQAISIRDNKPIRRRPNSPPAPISTSFKILDQLIAKPTTNSTCENCEQRDHFSEEMAGGKAFFVLYGVLKAIWVKASSQSLSGQHSIPKEVLNAYQEQIGQYPLETELPKEKAFILSYSVFVEGTNHILYNYFRHLYHLIKYTKTNAPRRKRKHYMGIIRAQFSSYEYALLYYHVLLFDKIGNQKPQPQFKKLVEKNCLLHNIQKPLLFDKGVAGSYRPWAYEHHSLFMRAKIISFKYIKTKYNDLKIETIIEKAVLDHYSKRPKRKRN